MLNGLWETILGRPNLDWKVSESFQEKGISKIHSENE